MNDVMIGREAHLHRIAVRMRNGLVKMDDEVLNIPLFMADRTDRMIGIALKDGG